MTLRILLVLTDDSSQTNDVLTLLSTKNGHYAAACSLDFSKPPHYYDTFALRDSEGHEAVMQSWPYFRARGSRHAMKSGSPVPVESCWNGMGRFHLHSFLKVPSIYSSNPLPSNSLHARLPLLRPHQTPPLPRHPRRPRQIPPRRLRMLSNPHRQPPHSQARGMAEPQRPRRLQWPRIRRSPRRVLSIRDFLWPLEESSTAVGEHDVV